MKALLVEVWRRVFNLAKAEDAHLFALFTFGGSRDGEYASSSAWNQRRKGKWHGYVSAAVIDAFFWTLFRDKDHCETSWRGQQHLYGPAV